MRILLTILLVLPLASASGQAVLDFSDHDFAKGSVTLSGQWDFYWDKLLSPDDLKSAIHASDLVTVPSSWNRDGNYPGLGKGTYRIKVRLPEGDQTDLSFYFPPVRCSARIWVNGILKDSLGIVGDREAYHSRLSGLLLSALRKRKLR
jgi:hypothetical protein